MKEKLNPVEEYRRISSKPIQFRVLCIFYVTNFCETKKKILTQFEYFFFFKFPEKQEVDTNLGALKIIFQRGCAVNNQDQKLFQLDAY